MNVDLSRHRTIFTHWSGKVAVMAIGLLLGVASEAQTLANAVEQAWSRHPQAATFNAREAQAQARVDLARGLSPAPASMSLSNVNDRFNTDGGKDAWELELAMPMWLPGQRAAHEREAADAVADVSARRAAFRMQIAAEVREAWWALAAARQTVQLAERREAAALALQSDVQRRFKAGELARTDANLAQNEHLAVQSDLLEARSALRQAEQTYRMLTGEAAPAVLSEERPAPAQELAPMHPQLAAVQSAAQLAQARLNVAQQSRRDAPELAVRVVRERGDFSAPYANALGIKLTLPFSSDARVRQETSAAQADALQANAELAQAQHRIELEMARARLDSDIAQQQMAKAQERLALTTDTLRLSEKSFALGESDLSALLRARSAAFEAEAYLNRQRIARAASLSRLNQSLGVMP